VSSRSDRGAALAASGIAYFWRKVHDERAVRERPRAARLRTVGILVEEADNLRVLRWAPFAASIFT